MALIYQAEISPSKIELLRAWVPSQPWGSGGLDVLGAYRFDDPAGEVGIETHLLRAADGTILQVPLTYRGAPLAGADDALITTMEHSVLGTRWVHDASADPVYVAALLTAVLTGGAEAEVLVDGDPTPRGATTRVRGSGTAGTAVPSVDSVSAASDATSTVVRGDGFVVTVLRVVPDGGVVDAGDVLTGTWPGRDESTVLAYVGV